MMIEVFIITVLVLWSCFIVLKKILPKTTNNILLRCAQACRKKGWHTCAKWLTPKMSAGCGGSCGCSTDDDASKSQEISTVKWK